jgi:hypothetical protein
MIQLAYGALLATLIFAVIVAKSRWVSRQRPENVARIRVLAAAASAGFGVLFAVVIIAAQQDGSSVVAYAIGLAAFGGAAVYIAGLVRWRGPTATWLRFIGAALMAAAAAIPSTLTLLAPLLAPLALTMGPVDDNGGPTRGSAAVTAESSSENGT